MIGRGPFGPTGGGALLKGARPSAADGEPAAGGEPAGVRIRLFDADRTDRVLDIAEGLKVKPSKRQLLWIDVPGDLDAETTRALTDRFDFDRGTQRALARQSTGPVIELHGEHFHVRVAAEPDPDRPEDAAWIDIAAGPNVVITRHQQPIQLLEALNQRIASDATIGELDSAEFVGSLLDAIVTSHHVAIDRLADELDDVDASALVHSRPERLFGRLVTMRRRIGQLRRLLAAHREVFATVGNREFGRVLSTADAEVFTPVAARFEGLLASVDSIREAVLGSFDILMTRTSQRTNDVMRALTLVTVMAVPATVTAGFLGMNVVVPVPNNDPTSFWLIAGFVILFELLVLGVARWRHWL
jgi:magnesium transporter